MSTLIQRAGLAGLLLLAAAGASAAATVTFKAPEQFADVPQSTSEREQVFKDLGTHFGRLAQTLPAGQELQVDVMDIDLAGHVWPSRVSAQDVRILNGRADWPAIKFHFTVLEGGKVVREGDERLTNMSYLQRGNRYMTDDPLRYEKQMLDDWFKHTVALR